MDVLTAHPITIALAIVSAVVWTAGNRNQSKKLVLLGVGLSLAAIAAFVLGK